MSHAPTETANWPPPIQFASTTRQTRVVYVITSHTNPDQIARLARACRSGSSASRVIVHHDYSRSALDPRRFEALGNVDVLRADEAVGWGGFGLISVVNRCARWALDRYAFDWMALLSGQDYPLRPLADIEAELAHSPYDGYLLSKPVEDLGWDVGAARYLYRYFATPSFKGVDTLRHLINRHQASKLAAGRWPLACVAREERRRIGLRLPGGPFRRGFRCHKGSTWWTLNRRSVEYMTDYADRNPGLAKYYRRVPFAPDESFYPTILMNNPELKLMSDDHKRFIRWSRPQTGHPDYLAARDFNEMVASGSFFARKIDGRQEPTLLDMLDRQIRLTPPPALSA